MQPDIFETFGIRHLSASSINKWMGDRGAWVAQYLFKLKGEMGPAVWRGQAVEDGLTAYVKGANEDPYGFAERSFEAKAIGEADDLTQKHRELVAPMLTQAITAWEDAKLGRPLSTQIKTELWLDGIPVPVIGFCDFTMDGYCLDLKTTERLPGHGKPSTMHALQFAGYAAARKETTAKALYVTKTKHLFCELTADDIAEGVHEMTRRAHGLAKTLDAALSKAGDDINQAKMLAAEMCPPDLDSFYWSDGDFVRAQELIPAWG